MTDDQQNFIVEQSDLCAYWCTIARDAAVREDLDGLIAATRKATAYARAFSGAVKDMMEEKHEGSITSEVGGSAQLPGQCVTP
jgi:hypothetical protein